MISNRSRSSDDKDLCCSSNLQRSQDETDSESRQSATLHVARYMLLLLHLLQDMYVPLELRQGRYIHGISSSW